MQPHQDWQTFDNSDNGKVYPYPVGEGSVVDLVGNHFEANQYQGPVEGSWPVNGGGLAEAYPPLHAQGLPTYSIPPSFLPPTPLTPSNHAGPSDYARYHNAHIYSANQSPYDFSTVQKAEGARTASSNVPPHTGDPASGQDSAAHLPAAGSQPRPLQKHIHPTSISTVRHYPNGITGPSLRRGMACGFCRGRKLRCDAERPECANCVKYRRECVYGPTTIAKGSEEDSTKDQAFDPNKTPELASSHISGTGNRNDSSTSLNENLVSPNNPSFPFNQSFPPRLGYDAVHHAQQPVLPMGPPGYTTSPDSMGNQQYGQQFPFDPQFPASGIGISTPHHQQPAGSTYVPPTQGSAPASTFTQFGTLSFPPWTGSTTQSPSNSGIPTPIMPSTPHTLLVHHQPLPEPLDIKPEIPTPNAEMPTFRRTPSDYQQHHTAPPAPVLQLRSRSMNVQSTNALRSLRSTPDPAEAPPPSMYVDPSVPYTYDIPPPRLDVLFTSNDVSLAMDPMDGLTARLGEFLFSPADSPSSNGGQQSSKEGPTKRRRQSPHGEKRDTESTTNGLIQPRIETDGLTNETRDQLLSIYLAHSRLFFEMSVPRFKYRLGFNDRRRPSLSLLHAMYLWASRMMSAPGKSPHEEMFFNAGCKTLEAQTSRADRLLDGMRAAMLLSAYAYTNGRYHEGYLLAGVAARLVISSGIHQIPSCTFAPVAPRNPLLRQKTFLLPPPEDKIELAERIHTFWAVFSIERCGALATGFPSALRDEDILTPFPRPMVDISSGNVTSRDDVTVRDLYRFAMIEVDDDPKLVKWLKALTILERATKLAFADPSEESEYAKAWSAHVMSHPSAPVPAPPAWLNQPRYRSPSDYRVIKLALDQFVHSMGVEGIFPVDRKRNAQIDGAAEPFISSHTLGMHHMLAATYMFLHDINSIDCENTDALNGARKCVALFKHLPPIPVQDVDSFVVVVWGMVGRTLVKEMHRLRLSGDHINARVLEEDADIILGEMNRVGETMGVSRTQAMGLEALKAADPATFVSE